MAKEKMQKSQQIDHIPHCQRKHRSAGSPKRRTDFSIFFCSSFSSCSSSSISNRPIRTGLLLKSLSRVDKLTTITGSEDTRDKRKAIIEFPLAECSSSQDKRLGLFSNGIKVPVIEVKSVANNAPFEGGGRKPEFIQDESQVTESNSICVAPGTVVWAKRACQIWWPAEIVGDRSTVADSVDQSIDGRVLVQYYGNRESAWVDPARDLSEFEEFFEERSCNSVDEFQDALKQALNQKERQSLSRQFSGLSDYPSCPNQGDQSPDKWNSSSSSRTESAREERRRGKRERKPKVHFDEVSFPLKSARRIRRFRIMRFLGLAAPVGSPF